MFSLVGCIAGALLVGNAIDTYLDFSSGPQISPTADQIRRYEILTALNVGCFAAVAILTAFFGRWWQAILTAILLLFALGWASVISVPAGRWYPPAQQQEPLPSYYRPCYSGSNDCN